MTDKKAPRFTFDSEKDGAEVPTLTSLLYRRNSVKSKGSVNSPTPLMSLEVTQTNIGDHSGIHMAEPTVFAAAEPVAETGAKPAAKPMERANPPEAMTSISMSIDTGAPAPLIQSQFANPSGKAETTKISHSKPIGKVIPAPLKTTPHLKPKAIDAYPSTSIGAAGLRELSKKTKFTTLVFEPTNPTTFSLQTIIGAPAASDRSAFWSGMEMTMDDFSDLWGRLKKFGFAEFSTLGAAGKGNYDRMAFRNAFQAASNEWVTLIRTEQADGKEALFAFLSDSSIQAHIPTFQSFQVPSSAAKAA